MAEKYKHSERLIKMSDVLLLFERCFVANVMIKIFLYKLNQVAFMADIRVKVITLSFSLKLVFLIYSCNVLYACNVFM